MRWTRIPPWSWAKTGDPLWRPPWPSFDLTSSVAWSCSALRTFPGANGLDVPAGSSQFKLQFLIYVPTADLFARMRTAQAAQEFQQEFLAGQSDDNGLERHITATRRQNFLVPPRRHRAFPLLELAAAGPRARPAALSSHFGRGMSE